MRIVTVGPLPPEWGGPKVGGVATSHRLLLEQLLPDHSIAVITRAVTSEIETIRPPKSASADWYADQVRNADVVVMLHVSHPMAIHHATTRPVPVVGAVHSWTPVLQHGKRDATIHGLSGADVLVFPSEHCRIQGQQLGFHYPAPTLVVPNALDPFFAQESDVGVPRKGVVFVGAPNVIKQPELAEQACRVLGIPFQIVTGKPRYRVREALLSAEVLCVPSQSESFGLAYIEAASCGTPSVGYAPAIREISTRIGRQVGVGVDSDVVSALATALSTSWDRGDLRRRTIRAYKPETMAAGYLDAMSLAIHQFDAAL